MHHEPPKRKGRHSPFPKASGMGNGRPGKITREMLEAREHANIKMGERKNEIDTHLLNALRAGEEGVSHSQVELAKNKLREMRNNLRSFDLREEHGRLIDNILDLLENPTKENITSSSGLTCGLLMPNLDLKNFRPES